MLYCFAKTNTRTSVACTPVYTRSLYHLVNYKDIRLSNITCDCAECLLYFNTLTIHTSMPAHQPFCQHCTVMLHQIIILIEPYETHLCILSTTRISGDNSCTLHITIRSASIPTACCALRVVKLTQLCMAEHGRNHTGQ
jgi:hypothetical protein